MAPVLRRCVSCRQLNDRSAFWRVVRLFDSHQVQLDQGMGRSAYLCPQASCLQMAQKKERLGRALKATVSTELYQALWQRLESLPSEVSTQSEAPARPGSTQQSQ